MNDAKKKAVELMEELLQNNWKLLELLQTMKPEDQLIYGPKVSKIVEETQKLITPK